MHIPKVIPPGTIVKLTKLFPHARKKGHEIGEIREVGFIVNVAAVKLSGWWIKKVNILGQWIGISC